MSKIIKISVRDLVEFVLRSGDIDNTFTSSVRAQEGILIHKKLQLEGGEAYTSEVSLKHVLEQDSYTFNIEGRADGIIKELDGITIDEIKTTARDLNSILAPNIMHIAQVKIYGYIYSLQNNIEEINIRVTYYNIKKGDTKKFNQIFSLKDLEEFLFQIINKYILFVSFQNNWGEESKDSIKKLKFPFNLYRKGQREMSVAVYNTIKEKRKIFINAPTGIGKTISTIFPAIKALGEGKTDKIFYLTAKTTNRAFAEEGIGKLRDKGLKIKSLTITSKEKTCKNDEMLCNPKECPYAKGHFDRINNALLDILEKEDFFGRDTIDKYASLYMVCPFEFSLDISLFCDVIICDYNYVFDPRVYLKRFFGEGSNGGEFTFLVDEVHNLVDRGRNMFSASLSKEDFSKIKKEVKDKKIVSLLNAVNKSFLSIKKKMDGEFFLSKDIIEEIFPPLNKLMLNLEGYFTSNEYNKELAEIYFNTLAYIKISEFYDERYVNYVELEGKNIVIKQFCIDPSFLLREALKRGKSAVFFSATLSPLKYYKEILGGEEKDYNLSLNSPFSNKNRLLLIEENISTKYSNRENTYEDIAEYIYSLYSCKRGNYIAFFPSYFYMEKVYELFKEKYNMNIYCQTRDMKDEDRNAFIERFDIEKDSVNFCVLGGAFSEGIDLIGDKLIGVIIVSVGIPMICNENNIIKDYFQNKNNKGYEFAYMYPGMNKVMQAAGRLIRNEEDRGIIILIDSRYRERDYINLFPKEWFPNICIRNKNDIIKYVTEFYKEERNE